MSSSWSARRAESLVKLGQRHPSCERMWCVLPSIKAYETDAGPRVPQPGDFIVGFDSEQYLVLERNVFQLQNDGLAQRVSL